jgi:purine-binding chemotaxis protein CheW
MSEGQEIEFVTVLIADQLFGLPITHVHDVFMVDRLTRVPLASPEIAGILNLRGRVVTTIDMRRRLDLPAREAGRGRVMALGIEHRGESYGLLIDSVGEVMKISTANCDPNPVNLDPRWAQVADGVVQLDGRLMVVLDVERVLEIKTIGLAA